MDVTFLIKVAFRRPGHYFIPMPRTARSAIGGTIYHVLNRGNGRMRIFRKPEDYPPFLQLMAEAKERAEVEIFGYCLMPNHWHVVIKPAGDQDLAAYFSWLTNTHVKRYRSHYQGTSGHLYQGRYKSFPVQEDSYLLTLLRYVGNAKGDITECHLLKPFRPVFSGLFLVRRGVGTSWGRCLRDL